MKEYHVIIRVEGTNISEMIYDVLQSFGPRDCDVISLLEVDGALEHVTTACGVVVTRSE